MDFKHQINRNIIKLSLWNLATATAILFMNTVIEPVVLNIMLGLIIFLLNTVAFLVAIIHGLFHLKTYQESILTLAMPVLNFIVFFVYTFFYTEL